jgi:tetratricopeptide (TPR) repeat protein
METQSESAVPAVVGDATADALQKMDIDDKSEDEENQPVVNDSSVSTDDELEGIPSTEKTEDLLLEATKHKEEGNRAFTEKDMERAGRSYRRGCNCLKTVVKLRSDDTQITSLYVALQTNLSMTMFKQNKYRLSANTASKALEVEAQNVKALYRRAVARRGLGDLDEATDDLRQALRIDAKNVACRKELAAVKRELERTTENQKKALAKAFSGGGSSFLYNDKEDAEKKRAEREKTKKVEEQARYKKRKQEWEDECVKRMAANQPAVSFEEWEKELQEAEKLKEKEEEAKRKEAEAKRKKEQRVRSDELRKKRETVKNDDSDTDDDTLTEQELAMMRGYKKTKDGRTTSYFTRELSKEETDRLGDIAPKRLDDRPQRIDDTKNPFDSPETKLSAWNVAGTWEEKDTTDWCTNQLRQHLLETTISGPTLDIDVVDVKELNGHASVALAGRKKRYIFEYDVKLEYEIKIRQEDKSIVKGEVRLPDICSTHLEEVDITFATWRTRPPKELEAEALLIRDQLADELNLQVKAWVDDFNGNY